MGHARHPRARWGITAVAVALVACAPSPTPSISLPSPIAVTTAQPSAASTLQPAPSPSLLPSPTPSGDDSEPSPGPDDTTIGYTGTRVGADLRAVAIGRSGLIAVGQDERGGVIWRSENGTDWTVAADDPSLDNVRLTGVAEDAALSVAIGCRLHEGTCAKGGIWYGRGGWHRAPTGSRLDRAILSGVAVFKGTAIVIGRVGKHPAAWVSADGQQWTRLVIDDEGTAVDVRGIASTNRGFLAVGRSVQLPIVLDSVDGHVWHQAIFPPDTRPGVVDAVGFSADEGFAIGGTDATDSDSGETIENPIVWHSRDRGRTWQRLDISPDHPLPGPAPGIAVGSAGVIVYGDESVFQSTDGVIWHDTDTSEIRGGIATATGFTLVGARRIWTTPGREVFGPHDPLAGVGNEAWQTLPEMPLVRPGFTAASDRKGTVFVFSDADGHGGLRVDRFFPDAGRWERWPTLAAAIRSPKAVSGPDGRIYLVGVSVDGRAGRTLAFDPQHGSIRVLAPIPTPRETPGIAMAADGRLYVLGGRAVPCCTGIHGDGALSVVERFDPRTNTWQRRRPIPVATASISAVADNNLVYVFLPARVWKYDITTDRYTAGPASITFGINGSATLGADGLIRVFGCTRYDLYDPAMNHWQPGQLFLTNRCDAVVVAALDADQIVVLGGDYTGDPGRIAESFFAGGG